MVSIMDDTATTTENSRPSATGAAAVAGAFACLLLALGLPRLIAAGIGFDSRIVVWNVFEGADVSAVDLASAEAGMNAAAAWVREGEREGERSLLLLHSAERAAEPGERAAQLNAAAAAATAALSVAPGQPSVWYRLAELRERLGDRDGAAAALRMSFLSGSFVPSLMESRVEMGLRLLQGTNTETADLLKRQIRLTWVARPAYVAELGARTDAGPLVREALAGLTETEAAQFQRLHGGGR